MGGRVVGRHFPAASLFCRQCQAAGRVWGMDDPGYLKLYLDELQKLNPSEYAMTMRLHPEYQKTLDMGS